MSMPPAFVHVDVDSWWAVRACYDDDSLGPDASDPIFTEALPALTRLFARHEVPASWFIIGRDAEVPEHAARLRELVRAGHRIENHSYTHDLNLGVRGTDRFAREAWRGQEAVGQATGESPWGFRAPGYSFLERDLSQLPAMGIRYDSSLLPTWAGPLLRLADARLRQAAIKPGQYGSWRRVFISPTPFMWPDGLVELPVMVSRPWRLPVHAGFCLIRGLEPLRRTLDALADDTAPAIFLIHGIDALDTRGRRHPIPSGRGQQFFNFSADEKLARLSEMLTLIRATRQVIDTRDWLTAHADSLRQLGR